MSRLISNIGVLISYLVIFTVTYLPVVQTHFFIVDDYHLLLPNKTQTQLYQAVFLGSISSGRVLAGGFEYFVFDFVRSLQSTGFDSAVRFVGIIGLVLLAYVIFIAFKANRIKTKYAFIASILICTLPAFQVYVSWLIINSVTYGTTFAAFAGLLMFKAVFNETRRSSLYRAVTIFTAVLSLVISLHFYQPAAMLYWSICIIPLSLLRDEDFTKKWRAPFIAYFSAGFASMAIHFLNVKIVNSVMDLSSFGRRGGFIPFTLDAIKAKMYWLFISSRGPLLQSLNLWNISPTYVLGGIVLIIILSGLLLSMRQAVLKAVRERQFNLLWNHSQRMLLIISIIPLSILPTLAVTENWATYRTIVSLEVSICILFFISLLKIRGFLESETEFLGNARKIIMPTLLTILTVLVVYNAHGNVKKYFADLHSLELQYVKNAIQEYGIPKLSKTPQIYFKEPVQQYIADNRFRFEFGYASTNEEGFGEYVTRLALYELGVKRKIKLIQVLAHATLPEDSNILIIDFTKLKFFLDEKLSKNGNNIK